jgi:heme-degrading monooxygenase HmoA
MYAVMSTVHGSIPAMEEVGRMTGDAMRGWLADLKGFKGLMILTDELNAVGHVLTFWESEESVVRTRATRRAMREKLALTVGVEVTAYEELAVAILELVDDHRPAA